MIEFIFIRKEGQALMFNLMLICGVGMSTSLIVEKIKDAAEKRNQPINCWAVMQSAAPDNYQKADVILLGPHVAYYQKNLEEMSGENPIKIGVIDRMDYAMFDGDKILDQALKIYNS